jgi:hypothetical protein
MSVTALVVNRVQPRFADDAQLADLAAATAGGPSGTALADLVDNLRGYTAASDREEEAYADLVAKVTPAPVFRIPLLNTDVHDLDGLGTIADLLFVAIDPRGGAPAEPSEGPAR